MCSGQSTAELSSSRDDALPQDAFKMDDLQPVCKRVFKKGAQHRDMVVAAAAPEAAAAETP